MLIPSALQQTIERMRAEFPWYDRMLSQLSVDLKKNEVLNRLPLITAKVLEEHYYTPDNPFYRQNELYRYQTSGTSSGLRKAIFYSKDDEEHYLRIKTEVFAAILKNFNGRTALADIGTGHAAATAIEVFKRLGMEAESVSFQLPIECHLERLEVFKPEVLYTMPSILDRIMLSSADPSAYGIRKVILVGEIASPSWQLKAADRLRISSADITDTYGSIEIGTIAYFSHEHGRYILADDLAAQGASAEELGEKTEPLAANEQILVLTSSARTKFPAVRFATYDVVRDLRPISVEGKSKQSFQCIVKRIGPELKHGEKISIYDIENVVYRHLGEAGLRVHVENNALTIHILCRNVSCETLEKIKQDITSQIPEIGTMISNRILSRINVIGFPFEDLAYRHSVKGKKIHYK